MKFEYPTILQSGVKGIIFDRYRQKWVVKVKGEYHGTFDTLERAVEFKKSLS